MPRFAAIEGLRAWLAWAVVFSHIAQSLGAAMHGGHMEWFERFGGSAVLVFIAISGFVITGLVLDKHETWPRYILRRAFRIFPAYWIAYAGALVALPLGVAALANLPWNADSAFGYDELLRGWTQAMADHPWQQVALHIALFQGVVPDSVWPLTSTAALGPAWSLTLEWQFYLIAPVFIWLVASERHRMTTAIVVALLALAFHGGLFGQYNLPTFLPGAAYIFMIGIACRIHFDKLKAAPIGPEAVPVIFALGLLIPGALFIAVWAAVLVYLLRADAWRAAGKGRRVLAAMDGALASKVATYLGARSYSVYLVHFPIIMATTWWISERWQLDQAQFFLALTVMVVPLTLLVSEILYRLVEKPMIRLGTWLAGTAKRPAAVAAG